MTYLSIGEVANQSGFAASTLRYYESAGVLPPPERVNGRRRYDPDVLYLLQAIGIAKQAGFTVDEMQQLFEAVRNCEAPSAVWERFARRKLEEVDELIARAHSMKALLEEGLRCGCLGMDECVFFGQEREPAPI